MNLVDTHCHIQSIGLEVGERTTRELWAKSGLNPDQVVTSAVDSRVTKLMCVGCDLEDSKLAIDFASGRSSCWVSIGLHPHEAQHYAGQQSKLDDFASLVSADKVVAIGECGLDFYYSHSPKEDQLEVLRFQIELALKHDKPMIFHVREAFDEFWPVFESYEGIRGVLHSFTDSADNLAKALEHGLYIGVNGIASFAKNPEQLEVYRSIPLSNLLLETDSPFLAPVPYRGKINQPSQLNAVADFLSQLRSEDRQLLADTTTKNAEGLFGI